MRFHVELLGDFEQLGQKPRHGNLVGGQIHNRFTDGAKGLGKILNTLVGGHIAGVKMHLGHAHVIPHNETIENFGEEHFVLLAEAPHDAEIEGDQCARVIHHQVALVHVGVEKSIADGMAQKTLDDAVAEADEIIALGPQRFDVGQAHAVDPFRCQHPLRGSGPVDFWQAETRIVFGVASHLHQRRGLHAEIKLQLHGLFQHVDGGDGAQALALA